jgi:hypothetical protein
MSLYKTSKEDKLSDVLIIAEQLVGLRLPQQPDRARPYTTASMHAAKQPGKVAVIPWPPLLNYEPVHITVLTPVGGPRELQPSSANYYPVPPNEQIRA